MLKREKPGPEKKLDVALINAGRLTNVLPGLCGDAEGVYGDASRIFGDITGINGPVDNLAGAFYGQKIICTFEGLSRWNYYGDLWSTLIMKKRISIIIVLITSFCLAILLITHKRNSCITSLPISQYYRPAQTVDEAIVSFKYDLDNEMAVGAGDCGEYFVFIFSDGYQSITEFYNKNDGLLVSAQPQTDIVFTCSSGAVRKTVYGEYVTADSCNYSVMLKLNQMQENFKNKTSQLLSSKEWGAVLSEFNKASQKRI